MSRHPWHSLDKLNRRERAELWDVVARERAAAGDKEGAKMARWQAKSIRSDFPVRRAGQ